METDAEWEADMKANVVSMFIIPLHRFASCASCLRNRKPRMSATFDLARFIKGLLSNTLGFRSTRSRGSLSGHSAAITSRTIGQRLPVPTWLAHTRSGMSEPEAVSVQPPMAGSHPGPGDSPRSNGSTFSPDGDRALLDVDLQNAPVTSVPAIPDVTNIQLPAAAGEAQNDGGGRGRNSLPTGQQPISHGARGPGRLLLLPGGSMARGLSPAEYDHLLRSPNVRNVTTQLGQTMYLHCIVDSASDRMKAHRQIVSYSHYGFVSRF
ncbi:hypothetical protein MRX96_019444 [Rhipicephalus microplus]